MDRLNVVRLTASMEKFTMRMPDDVLRDLAHRLAATRWAPPMPQSGWGYGTDQDYLRELVEYWRSGFDWRTQETRLNRLSQYRATVDGTGVHFIWERGQGPDPFPLIVMNGWPSTFAEMERLIPLLTHPDDPADAFDVVVPAHPGFGFSDKPAELGDVSYQRIAARTLTLLRDHLGYQRFGAAGGDVGGSVALRLGMDYAEHVAGVHTDSNGLIIYPLVPQSEATEEEQPFLQNVINWMEAEGAYSMLQATKPASLAPAMHDSPSGLAAYLVEKFRSWSDSGGQVECRFSKDDLLTNATLYWATESIGSSFLAYYDAVHYPQEVSNIEVPVGVALWPADPVTGAAQPPRSYAERWMNVQRWTQMPAGGHFFQHEEPELYDQELREFFRPLRK